uniref:Uncharacterized protein n=1 Tax=Arundo donax TaxID=35708 RepID=A0A0A9BDW4_ARUDO
MLIVYCRMLFKEITT